MSFPIKTCGNNKWRGTYNFSILIAVTIILITTCEFPDRNYDIEDTSERRRYEDARKFGMMYTKHIDLLSYEDRLRDLRQFSRMTCPSKIRHIQAARN